jgi:hypothetical protein
LKSLGLSLELFRRHPGDETILLGMKPFWAFGAEFRKPATVIKRPTNTGGQASNRENPERTSMRTVSFILAIVFVVAGSSMAGSVESGLPGVGTFSYNGTSPTQTLIVAVR